MSETLYKSLARRDQVLAGATYRHLWVALKSQGIEVTERSDPKNKLDLPVSENDSTTKIEIPPGYVIGISELPQDRASQVLDVSSRKQTRGLLNRRDILGSFKEVSNRYRKYLEVVQRSVKDERADALKLLVGYGLMYLFYKGFESQSGVVPEFLSGRVVDLLAVPSTVVYFKFANTFWRRGLRNRREVLDKSPEEVAENFSYVDNGTVTGLAFSFLAEDVQYFTGAGGFDEWDYAAYAAGAVLSYLWRKPQEMALKRRIIRDLNSK